MKDNFDILDAVNRCQIAEMEKLGQQLNPVDPASCEQFGDQVRNVQAVIIHTWQVTAFASLREPDPAAAAEDWKQMSQLCDSALTVLKQVKDKYPHCGAPELSDLTLDYKLAADKRHYENLEDAECAQIPAPKGLFPLKN